MPDETREATVPMQIRLTPEQHALFKRLARAEGRSLSNWARRALEQHAATARTEEKASTAQ